MEYGIHVSVLTYEQLKAVLKAEDIRISRIYVDYAVAINNIELFSSYREKNFYLCSPFVFRHADIERFDSILKNGYFKGILVRNLETFAYLNFNYEKYSYLDMVLDCNMYILNFDSFLFYKENSKIPLSEYYTSYELNAKEQNELITGFFDEGYPNIIHSFVGYGRIPMMVSANCINKTTSNCVKCSGFSSLEDRLKKVFPIYSNCDFCYNVIYNCVPLSLHKYFNSLILKGNVRLDFSIENYIETKDIMSYFISLFSSEDKPIYDDYTTGHYKRGVE